jgi:hypothetical protein
MKKFNKVIQCPVFKILAYFLILSLFAVTCAELTDLLGNVTKVWVVKIG